MKYFIDTQNDKGDYCYHAFENALFGDPLLVLKEKLYLLIPVLNLGIYDLKSFKNGFEEVTFVDKSYYFFTDIFKYDENVSLRVHNTFYGNLEKKYMANNSSNEDMHKSFRVEVENGLTRNYSYGATWNVKAREFGVLLQDDYVESMYEQDFKRSESQLSELDFLFLMNRKQKALDEFIEKILL